MGEFLCWMLLVGSVGNISLGWAHSTIGMFFCLLFKKKEEEERLVNSTEILNVPGGE